MIKKNNSTISVLQQWNIVGLVDAYLQRSWQFYLLADTVLCLYEYEFLLEFHMLDLNQVFNLLSVEKDLSASQLETGNVFTTTGE